MKPKHGNAKEKVIERRYRVISDARAQHQSPNASLQSDKPAPLAVHINRFDEMIRTASIHAIDYNKLKMQMRQLIRLAQEVIAECEKDAPDDILISDDANEELFELSDQIIMTVNGVTPSLM